MSIAAQRAAGEADAHGFMDRLLAARDPETGEGLNDEAIIDNVVTFVGAGHETTALALARTLYVLAHQQGLAERLEVESRRVLGDTAATADARAAFRAGGRQAADAGAQRDAAAVRRNAAEGESVEGIVDIRKGTSYSKCACRFDGAAEYTALTGVTQFELAGALRSILGRPRRILLSSTNSH